MRLGKLWLRKPLVPAGPAAPLDWGAQESVSAVVSGPIQVDPWGGAVYRTVNQGIRRDTGIDHRSIWRRILSGEDIQSEVAVRAWRPPSEPQPDAFQLSDDLPDITGDSGRPIEPRPVTERIKEEHKRKTEERRAARPPSPTTGRLEAMRAAVGGPARSEPMISTREAPFYSVVPVIQRLSTTWEGRTWVVWRPLQSTRPVRSAG